MFISKINQAEGREKENENIHVTKGRYRKMTIKRGRRRKRSREIMLHSITSIACFLLFFPPLSFVSPTPTFSLASRARRRTRERNETPST
jgi:hypothetical protein